MGGPLLKGVGQILGLRNLLGGLLGGAGPGSSPGVGSNSSTAQSAMPPAAAAVVSPISSASSSAPPLHTLTPDTPASLIAAALVADIGPSPGLLHRANNYSRMSVVSKHCVDASWSADLYKVLNTQ
jgi:hypothetical protein